MASVDVLNPNEDLRFQQITKTPSSLSDATNSTTSGSDMSSWLISGLSSSYGAALFIAILTCIFLATMQPPFVKTESTVVEEGHLNWWSVGLWTLIVFLLVLMIPPVKRFCGTAFTSPPSVKG